MIVYGDASRPVGTAAALAEIRAWVEEAVSAALPVERHAAWVSALIAAGCFAQGVADAARDTLGHETAGADEARTLDLALVLARVVGGSWDTGFAALPEEVPAAAAQALAALAREVLPATVTIRRPEGFSHYAVYPESYWAAAAGLAGPRPTSVIGIRSIGTSLGATVAAALGAPMLTLRPTGHPFARRVEPCPALDAALRHRADAAWAIVDEGPGLSGSSFGAVAEALAERGVGAERITLFPSHGNPPGAMAGGRHRELWARARRVFVPFEALLLERRECGLADWVSDITGPLRSPPLDLAGGNWRGQRLSAQEEWPCADRQNERRKYLLHGARGRFLLKFTGLGSLGREKYARARALADAGFCIAPLGWRHGFIVEPWRSDLATLSWPAEDRGAFLDNLASYVAYRARAFPASPHDGAPLAALLDMTRANAAEALGEDAARSLSSWAGRLPALTAAARPVAIDGRLAAHEWLRDERRGFLKTDALDHCAGHDLVGCQDAAWDVAGAATEFLLTEGEVEALRTEVARRSDAPCDAGLVAFFRVAYPAFTAGALALAMARETDDADEAARLDAAYLRRVAALGRALA